MSVSIVLIGLQEAQQTQVEHSLAELPGVRIGRRVPNYPEATEVARLLRAVNPAVVFISTGLPVQMEAAVLQVTAASPQAQVVLVDSTGQSDTLLRAMHLGVRECLSLPFVLEDLRGVIERSMTRRGNAAGSDTETNGSLYSFLPVRSGVGASILATQCALSLPVDADHRGLLLDADLDAGMVRFLLKVETPYSLVEAVERVEELDEQLWPKLVTQRGNLDIMPAGEAGSDYRADLGRMLRVLDFIRRQYSAIVVDLPEAINRLSTELMQQSKAVFLVTTAEVASLHMASLRLRQLQDLGLTQQILLLVNRVEKNGGISLKQIASTLGVAVHATFANDYAEVQKAILTSSRLPVNIPLSRQLLAFAESLWTAPVKTEPLKKRRFLEVFALPR